MELTLFNERLSLRKVVSGQSGYLDAQVSFRVFAVIVLLNEVLEGVAYEMITSQMRRVYLVRFGCLQQSFVRDYLHDCGPDGLLTPRIPSSF
jgi:hypothetical protein